MATPCSLRSGDHRNRDTENTATRLFEGYEKRKLVRLRRPARGAGSDRLGAEHVCQEEGGPFLIKHKRPRDTASAGVGNMVVRCNLIPRNGGPWLGDNERTTNEPESSGTSEPNVFDGTVRDNLDLADPPATDSARYSALAAVALGDTVAAFPLGLETPVGTGGGCFREVSAGASASHEASCAGLGFFYQTNRPTPSTTVRRPGYSTVSANWTETPSSSWPSTIAHFQPWTGLRPSLSTSAPADLR
jgi:hypothetical protein